MHIRSVAFLVALGLAPGAFAQTDAENGAASGPDWAGPIAEAFFSDPEMTALRPEAELRANWEALRDADRALVRRDCAAMTSDAEDLAGAASGGVSDVEPAEAGAPGAGAAGAPVGLPAGGATAMAEACSLVEGD